MKSELATQTKELVTVIDFLRFGLSCANARQLYYGHGTDNAWDDVWTLVLESLSLPIDVDPLLLNARLTADEKARLTHQLEQRLINRVPVPYLTHKASFCGLTFYVDERVLIPRSPIAELIEQQFTPWVNPEQITRVLDLCTGSGCIGIACCYAFPAALVDAVDISKEALAVAAINQQRHQVDEQLTLLESDVFAALPPVKYDLIVSNPPYVGWDEMHSLPKEYHYEPKLALEAEKNGLAIVDKILSQAHHYLSEHGVLLVEVGNSEIALIDAYPDLPFMWLDFERGGQGVFLLTRQQLSDYFST